MDSKVTYYKEFLTLKKRRDRGSNLSNLLIYGCTYAMSFGQKLVHGSGY